MSGGGDPPESSNSFSAEGTQSPDTAQILAEAACFAFPRPAPAATNAAPVTQQAELAQEITQQMISGTYECMICTEMIRRQVATWSCSACYRVFHLYCIKKWSHSEESGAGLSFRCPSCQHQHNSSPAGYVCFCGRMTDPPDDHYITPHSCGEPCGRKKCNCPHPCVLRCHPGPCPRCKLSAQPKPCPCGATTYVYPCGTSDPLLTCKNTCAKPLACGTHVCQQLCHYGPCPECPVLHEVECKCRKNHKPLPCGSKYWECDQPCGKTLRCGVHKCGVVCHTGECPPCDTDPSIITTCPCGNTPLTTKRTTCMDPIPTCGNVCGKVLPCAKHTCPERCHAGPCPPCRVKSLEKCRCGASQQKVLCGETFECRKVCKAKLACGKHECQELCCPHRLTALGVPGVHMCSRKCLKKLPCGHTCDEACHRGACPMCPRIITTELFCACGAEVLPPPLPCGTEPPKCHRLCNKLNPCGHQPVPHECHFGACPKCVVPTDKTCVGGHKVLHNIMCCADAISCNGLCLKPLPCNHQCQKKCHGGACFDPQNFKCTQPCGAVLPCGHNCVARCHPGAPCPKCACTVTLTCDCGVRMVKMPCSQHMELKSKLSAGDASAAATLRVDCNDDCLFQQRLNVLMSLRGGITSGSSQTVYFSQKLWDEAKRNVDLTQSCEKHLVDFMNSSASTVMLPAMPKEKRMVMHELAHVFRVRCDAFDAEPKRSCQLSRMEFSRIPPVMLSQAVYKEENNPQTIVDEVLHDEKLRYARVFYVAEPTQDIYVHNALFPFGGDYILTNGPQDRPATATCFAAVFCTPVAMSKAYGYVKRGNSNMVLFREGESNPINGLSTLAPPQAVAAPTPHKDPQDAKGHNWAQKVRGRGAKPRTENVPIETSNMFSAIGLRKPK